MGEVERGVYTPRPLHMIDTSDRNLVKIFREITLTMSVQPPIPRLVDLVS